MKKLNILIFFATFIIILSFVFGNVFANQYDNYPERTIEIIVPFSAGGGSDTLTRIVIKYLADLGIEPVVPINIVGAAGGLGLMETIARAGDPYTMYVFSPHGLMTFYGSGTHPRPGHKELTPIASVANDPNVIQVNPNIPIYTFEELIEYAKKHPGKLNLGISGIGGINHLFTVDIFDKAGVEVKIVPYDGASNVRAAGIGGHVDIVSYQVSEGFDLSETGDMRSLVVTSKERSPFLPNVPCLSEFGYDVDYYIPRAFWGPPDMPEPVVKKLEEAFRKICEIPEFKEELEGKFGYQVKFMGHDDLVELIEQQSTKWEQMAADLTK